MAQPPLPWEAIVPFLDGASAARVVCCVRGASAIVGGAVRALEAGLGLEVPLSLPAGRGATARLQFLQGAARYGGGRHAVAAGMTHSAAVARGGRAVWAGRRAGEEAAGEAGGEAGGWATLRECAGGGAAAASAAEAAYAAAGGGFNGRAAGALVAVAAERAAAAAAFALPETAIAVSAGAHFSAVLLRGGAVRVQGAVGGSSSGSGLGLLGSLQQEQEHEEEEAEEEGCSADDDAVQAAQGERSPPVPPPLPLPQHGLGGIGVRAVSAGAAHVLLVSRAGRLFSFGSGTGGRLGLGHERSADSATHVRFGADAAAAAADEVVVASADAGSAHSLVVTAGGELFSFGWGEGGRLGLGDEDDRLRPARVRLPGGVGRARCASAGGAHSLVCTTRGDLLAFGVARYGRLGLGVDEARRLAPCVSLHGVDHAVLGCAAGGEFSLAWTGAGMLVACGRGRHGQLGLGDTRNRLRFSRVDGVADLVVDAACGQSHALVVTQAGAVYAFGDDYNCATGVRCRDPGAPPVVGPALSDTLTRPQRSAVDV